LVLQETLQSGVNYMSLYICILCVGVENVSNKSINHLVVYRRCIFMYHFVESSLIPTHTLPRGSVATVESSLVRQFEARSNLKF
jgi:hypothetical protein